MSRLIVGLFCDTAFACGIHDSNPASVQQLRNEHGHLCNPSSSKPRCFSSRAPSSQPSVKRPYAHSQLSLERDSVGGLKDLEPLFRLFVAVTSPLRPAQGEILFRFEPDQYPSSSQVS